MGPTGGTHRLERVVKGYMSVLNLILLEYIYIYQSLDLLMSVRKIFSLRLIYNKFLKVHCTFANWRKSRGILAKVRWTFANWRNSTECIGESTVDFCQLVKFRGMYWRKYSGFSPMVKVLLAKVLLEKFRNPVMSRASYCTR